MNFSLNAQNGVKRLKRDEKERKEAREIACKGLEYGSVIAETIADVAGDINSIPVVGEVTGIVTGTVAAVSHISKGGMEMSKIALGCDDIPFDEIKEIMNDRFNELDRKLDQNTEALKKVTKMVSKTLLIVEKVRLEMNEGFDRVVAAIENNVIKDKVVGIHILAQNFVKEKNRIRKLPKEGYVSNLEGSNFLSNLRESRTSNKNTLYTLMHEIIYNEYALPKHGKDLIAFQALYALFYGTQTFVSIFGFLIETHSYIAEYHYQKGDYEQFNKQVDVIVNVFHDFKFSILGDTKNEGILVTVSNIIKNVKNKNIPVETEIYEDVANRSEVLGTLKKQIKKMKLQILRDVPPTATILFNEPKYDTPLGSWRDGVTVRYAVQYEVNGLYSKLSEWTEAYRITDKACPYVSAKSDKRNRLIFRRFDNNAPQLVVVLKEERDNFRDIHRDLYNAIGNVDMEAGCQEASKLILKGADINAKFELGRTSLHNAAKSCNVNNVELILENGFQNINAKDEKGYTALHVAVSSRCLAIISKLISKGANVNVATTEGFTPLHLAAREGYTEIVDELIKAEKINVNAKDNNGFTPTHFAVGTDENVLTSLMLADNVDLKAKSTAGISIGHFVAMKGDNKAIFNLSASQKFDINAVDINNMTPLHYAAVLGNAKMVEAMARFSSGKINLNIEAKGNNWTPLHYAVFLQKTNVALELLKYDSLLINPRSIDDATPLHMAVGKGQEKVVKAIIKKNRLTVEDKTIQGYTALHLAAIRDSPSIATLLVKAGANVEEKTNNNETPLDLAKKYKSNNVINYLQSLRRFYRSLDFLNPHSIISGKAAYDLNVISSLKNKELNYGIAPKEMNFNSGKLLNPNTRNSFGRYENSPIRAVDTNGTLLLMDLLLRKFRR